MTPLPVIIDTDPGTDDAVALLLALASPELALEAVTAVAGNVGLGLTFANARRVAALAGRPELPVHAGAARPLLRAPVTTTRIHGEDGLGGAILPEPEAPASRSHAVDVLVSTLAEAALGRRSRPTICALGPLTNLALAFAYDRTLAQGVERVVMMGGTFRPGGNATPAAEYNVFADPHAAKIVFDAGVPIVMMPLDVTHRALMTAERYAALAGLGGRIGPALGAILAAWDRNDIARFGVRGGPLHDPTVIAYLLRPDLFEGVPAHVDIECAATLTLGQTVADWRPRSGATPNAQVMTGLDADGFFALLSERLARL